MYNEHENRGKSYFIWNRCSQLKLLRNLPHVLFPTKPILNVTFRMLSLRTKTEICENHRKMVSRDAQYKH